MPRQPDYLYHYTTAKGLIGIVTGKKLWATNIFYLNDQTEFRFGMELGKQRLQALAEKAEGDEKDRYNSMATLVSQWMKSKDSYLYVCSFSEAADDLSQWRAYCPAGGYAIGFPADKLRQVVGEHDFELRRCVYDPKRQVEEIEAAIDRRLHTTLSEGLSPCDLRDEPKHVRVLCTLLELSETAARLKDQAFVSEQEWRLVSSGLREDDARSLRFRSRHGMVIPYQRCSLESKEAAVTRDLWEKVRIIVGPNRELEASIASVKRLIRTYSPISSAAQVTPTSVPYRFW